MAPHRPDFSRALSVAKKLVATLSSPSDPAPEWLPMAPKSPSTTTKRWKTSSATTPWNSSPNNLATNRSHRSRNFHPSSAEQSDTPATMSSATWKTYPTPPKMTENSPTWISASTTNWSSLTMSTRPSWSLSCPIRPTENQPTENPPIHPPQR